MEERYQMNHLQIKVNKQDGRNESLPRYRSLLSTSLLKEEPKTWYTYQDNNDQ